MRLTIAALALALLPLAAQAENYEIDVVLPLTGTGAFIGKAQQQALTLEEKLFNAEGGTNGRPVHFVIHDDQTNPQVSVQLVTDILGKQPVVLMGPSLTAMCRATMPLMTEGPVEYCYTPSVNPEPGSYVFSSQISQAGLIETVVRYFHARGWNKLALIASTDATGQEGEKGIERAASLPDLPGMSIVEKTHYNPTDLTVTAQVERMKAAAPDAVIAWTTGTPVGTVFKALAQSGWDVPFAPGTGNLLYTFMHQFEAVLPKQLYLAAPQGAARGEGMKLDPRVLAAKKKYYELFQTIGAYPDTGAETVWDPTRIVIEALRHAGPQPTAKAVRDYILQIRDFAGVSGIYNYAKSPQRGISGHDAVMTRWNAEKTMFEAVSQPGGDELIVR
jgi:branched-chain amino acid transport system substrate-binding protein